MEETSTSRRKMAEGLRNHDVLERADTRSQSSALLLRTAGAAALCSTSSRTWRMWGMIGRIPRPVYIGRIPFWRYDELKAWVAAGCPDRATWDAIRE